MRWSDRCNSCRSDGTRSSAKDIAGISREESPWCSAEPRRGRDELRRLFELRRIRNGYEITADLSAQLAEPMCGIAGIVGIEPSYVAKAVDVHRMCQTIVHRGPDDEGIYAQGRAGLGMRRLSIIDLSTGHQPIHNEDHDLWVVFNGEIYNFPELRPELEARGHRFYTNSDTEVILHLYEEYGADCVKRLLGLVALAVSDQRRHKLLLRRASFGKKPLYYAMGSERLVFGSEIKALLAAAPELAEIDHPGLLNFFYFVHIPVTTNA